MKRCFGLALILALMGCGDDGATPASGADADGADVADAGDTGEGGYPNVPKDLTATGISMTAIEVAWTDVSEMEESFQLRWALDVEGVPGEFYGSLNLPANTESHTLDSFTAGTTYWFQLLVVGGWGFDQTPLVSGSTFPVPPPNPPTDLEGEALSPTDIELTWTDNSDDELVFEIERADDVDGAPGTWVDLPSGAPANDPSWHDQQLEPSTTYWYRVFARKEFAGTDSAPSNEISVTTWQPAPEAPTDLTAVAVSSSRVILEWTDGSDNEDAILLERRPKDGQDDFAEVLSAPPDTVWWQDEGLEAETAYLYRVRASNSTGPSPWSDVAEVMTLPAELPCTVQVAAGSNHTLVRTSEGEVWAWGLNMNGELGIGTEEDGYAPQRVLGLSGATQVAAGEGYSLAVDGDGAVWSWGYNQYGELGNGTVEASMTPSKVAGLPPIIDVVAGGYHVFARAVDGGSVWGWGANFYGHLGDGTLDDHLTPVQLAGHEDYGELAAGSMHSLAIDGNGMVLAWGFDVMGQLGQGAGTAADTKNPNPIPALGLPGPMVDVAAGRDFSLALSPGGTVWAWGDNTKGQLGNGAVDPDSVSNGGLAFQVGGLGNVVLVDGGHWHAAALTDDGNLWTWGANQVGQLGKTADEGLGTTPAKVDGFTGVVDLSVGFWHGVTRTEDGVLQTFGSNGSGAIGWGKIEDPDGPVTPDQAECIP